MREPAFSPPLAPVLRPSHRPVAILVLAAACTPSGAPDPCHGPPDLLVGETRVTLSVEGCGSVDLFARVLGEGDLRVGLNEVDGAVRPTIAAGQGGGRARGVVLEGTFDLEGDGPLRWWRQGYQSWSWSGVLDATPVILAEDGLPEVGGDGDAFSLVSATPFTSWWAGLLGRPSGPALHVGAVTAERAKVWLAADDGSLFVVWGGRGEERILQDGDTWTFDRVHLALAHDPWAQWTDWAAEVAAATGAAAPDEPPPVGWATWYQHYSAIDEATVRANLATGATLDWGAEAPVFQIDDGWQAAWGDWRAGPDFPSGMASVAEAVETAGFVPGLWMAPLYVDRGTATYQAHPDWWVRDPSGAEIAFSNVGTGDYAVLDVTHPEAAAWLADQVAARVDEGWRYLKLDFLYAGAQEGLRAEEVTGTEAYRIALDLLREAAGPDTWILACGAPLLPSVGFADSYRSGADIAFEITPDPHPAFVRWQVRQTAARAWANGAWWWNDPDQVLVRAPLTPPEARGAVVGNALSGGAWLLGDDLVDLPADRLALALAPEAMHARGATVRPLDPLNHPSGFDASPLIERVDPDDDVPVLWRIGADQQALYNAGQSPLEAWIPGGVEVLTGRRATGWTRVTLAPGEGQLWQKR